MKLGEMPGGAAQSGMRGEAGGAALRGISVQCIDAGRREVN